MHRGLVALTAASFTAILGVDAAPAAEIRVGFVTTVNHILGKEQLAGFRLGLAHEGWTKDGDKIAGVPMSLFICDDQFKPDVGKTCANSLLRRDEVHVVAGFIWSHVLMAAAPAVTRQGRVLMSTNAGPAPLAGKKCSKYFVSSANQNDTFAEGAGRAMAEQGMESAVLLAPNYQAGKDMLAGVKRQFKGEVKGEILFKTGQKDFAPELSKIRALDPEAIFVFAPGPMGIAFVKQWKTYGLSDKVRLFSAATVDFVTLPAIGDAAIGAFHAINFNADTANPVSQRFIKDYIAKTGRHPSAYSAHAYDGARILVAGLKKLGGKTDDLLALVKAMRDVDFPSTRPEMTINVNGFPIQNVYLKEVVNGADDKPTIKTVDTIIEMYKDRYWQQCPESERH